MLKCFLSHHRRVNWTRRLLSISSSSGGSVGGGSSPWLGLSNTDPKATRAKCVAHHITPAGQFLSISSSRSRSSSSSSSKGSRVGGSPWSRLSNEIVANPESKRAKRVAHRITNAGQFMQVLEQELAENSAGALGGSQRKLDVAYKALMRYRERNDNDGARKMKEHNELRKIAFQRREELVIHRQCCGFRLNNDILVTGKYPIPTEWMTLREEGKKHGGGGGGQPIVVPRQLSKMEHYRKQQKEQQGRSQQVPPSNYICNKCMTPGHWRENCTK